MTRLNEDLHPSLTKPVLQKLFSKSIFTTIDFIRTESELLSGFAGLEYSEIIPIRNTIFSKFSSPIRYGRDSYKDILNYGAMVSTGIENFDKLVNGGLTTGNIYELCGSAASGKTQLCMSIAINISLRVEKQKVLYVDTRNDLNAHRILEIFKNRKISDDVMSKIKISQIKSAYELVTLLHSIIKELKNNAANNYRVIIIDSLAAIFYQFLGDDSNEGLCLLNNIANLLHYISVEFYVAVVITNLITTWTLESSNDEESFTSIRQPALGKYWAHVPNARIHVQKLSNTDEILLTILKSFNQPVGKTIKLVISNEGVL